MTQNRGRIYIALQKNPIYLFHFFSIKRKTNLILITAVRKILKTFDMSDCVRTFIAPRCGRRKEKLLEVEGVGHVTQCLIAVFHKYVFHRHTSRWVKLIFGFIRRILHCVVRKFGYLRNKDTSLWSFVLCVIVLYLIFYPSCLCGCILCEIN